MIFPIYTTNINGGGKSQMRKEYPSDISRKQFEEIRPLLESARKKTRPREIDLYELFCAVLYILKSACQWRMLPRDFPKWQSVYAYFKIWGEKREEGKESILEEVLKKNGCKNTYRKWQEWQDFFLHRGRTEC
jgi:transposase